MNDATEVTNWIVQYQATELSDDTEEKNQKREEEKKELLTKILNALKPMLLARCSYYFGYTTEDLIQMGYARMIACYYFSLNRKMRKDRERLLSFEQETLESVLVAEDAPKYEYDWKKILSVLNEKEYRIVTEHILNKKTLKTLSHRMHISYPYAKKLKSSALKKLRCQLQSVACV